MERARSSPGHPVPETPTKKRIVDRYIPDRESIDLQAAFSLAANETHKKKPGQSYPSVNRNVSSSPDTHIEGESPVDAANRTYSTLLKAELFGDMVPSAVPLTPTGSTHSSPESKETPSLPTTPRRNKNLFSYSPSRRQLGRKLSSDLFSSSPVRPESQALLLSPQKKPREIAKTPYRVLDAPNLADDFYLNLVDWGSQNKLAVGLGSLVYIWDAATGVVNQLCNLTDDNTVASVSWLQSGGHLAVGTDKGTVHLWDIETGRRIRNMQGHSERAGCLSWNNHILSSGSRDYSILHRDVRVSYPFIGRLKAHRGEVCGLKWNPDINQLASGCNDNKLFVWNGLSEEPLFDFHGHRAAIKALAWSPHQRGLLASGGGSSDMKICLWNTLTGIPVSSTNTGSQISNLAWSIHTRELVSTHGYAKNHVAIWKYPSMKHVISLTGHTHRVLYLSMSPDGRTIVTGAGDETLRLWNIFNEKKDDTSSMFNMYRQLR